VIAECYVRGVATSTLAHYRTALDLRLIQLGDELEHWGAQEPFATVVARLRCFRVSTLPALVLAMEAVDFARFAAAAPTLLGSGGGTAAGKTGDGPRRGARSRSHTASGGTSPMMSRCESHMKQSTRRSTCKVVVLSAAT